MITKKSLMIFCLVFPWIGSGMDAQENRRLIDSPVGSGKQGFGGDGGKADEALLDQPFDVTVDIQGRILFSDTFNHRIRRFDPKTGLVETIAGSGRKGFSGDGGPALKAELNEPY